MKLFVIIWTCSTLLHVNLILHPLHFVMQKFSHMKLSYLLLKKKVFNLLDDEYFTTPYVIYTIPNSPAGHQITTQAKKFLWIIDINV